MLRSCSMTQRGRALWFLRSLNKVMFRRLLSLQLLSYYNSIRKTFGAKQDSLARVCFCYSFTKMLPSHPSSPRIQFQYLHKSDFFSHLPLTSSLSGWVEGQGSSGWDSSVPGRWGGDHWLLAAHGVMPLGSDGEGAPGLLPPSQEAGTR